MSSLIKNYYTNGCLMEIGTEVNGIKEGKWVFYYDNGRISKEIFFSNGVEHGEWKMWHENGNLYLVQNKENGQTFGLCTEFYESGQIKEIGDYNKGEYFPIDFWNEAGEQLLKKGTGKKIEKFGYLELDIVEQYFNNGQFIKEEKISTAQYSEFKPSHDR